MRSVRRIQCRRSRGWHLPSNTIYVDRPSRWGNPFRIGVDGNREEVLSKYRKWLTQVLVEDPDFLEPLRGKDLACFCATDESCHAEILLELANSDQHLGGIYSSKIAREICKLHFSKSELCSFMVRGYGTC